MRGSSVTLACLAENTTKRSWYTKTNNGSVFVWNELFANGIDTAYKLTEDGNFTLTIRKVRESDENFYCCKATDSPDLCQNYEIKLQVADLQVKVFPSTNAQAVTLMCNTSCPLTKNPAAFVWYKNRELLYEDWSPWYRELVSSEKAVKYSCAINDGVNARSPEVSVDSVTPNCFSVTYAEGRICPHDLKSVNVPCSITYAKDLHIQLTSLKNREVLSCITSCPEADPHTAFEWYSNREKVENCQSQDLTVMKGEWNIFSCAVKNNKALHSDEMCIRGNCPSVGYVSRRICALEGWSVNISTVHSYQMLHDFKSWYKKIGSVEENNGTEALVEDAGHVEFHTDEKNHNILRIIDLRRNDSAEYMYCIKRLDESCIWPNVQGVLLIVTGLRVTMVPSAEVTEGQRVTLTCSTSCPLPENTAYIWFFNKQNLSMTLNQNKHILLDPVSSQHVGNYSCAVNSSLLISSPEQALTVKARVVLPVAIMNIVKLVFLVLILSAVSKLCMIVKKRKTVTATPEQREKEQTVQAESLYEQIVLKNTNAPPERGEKGELHE